LDILLRLHGRRTLCSLKLETLVNPDLRVALRASMTHVPQRVDHARNIRTDAAAVSYTHTKQSQQLVSGTADLAVRPTEMCCHVTLKSGLRVTRGHWKWHRRTAAYDLLSAFHSNFGHIGYHTK